MGQIKIELPNRSWKEFSAQGLQGRIVKFKGEYQLDVEVMELQGESFCYPCVCVEIPVKLTT